MPYIANAIMVGVAVEVLNRVEILSRVVNQPGPCRPRLIKIDRLPNSVAVGRASVLRDPSRDVAGGVASASGRCRLRRSRHPLRGAHQERQPSPSKDRRKRPRRPTIAGFISPTEPTIHEVSACRTRSATSIRLLVVCASMPSRIPGILNVTAATSCPQRMPFPEGRDACHQ